MTALAVCHVCFHFFLQSLESHGTAKEQRPLWTMPLHTWLALPGDWYIFWGVKQKNNFSINNLFPKRKVSSCGSGVQWCNITVLQGTGFSLEKNLKRHLSLLWCREVSFWEVRCLWWSISHTQLIFCFSHGIQEHTFTPLLCVLTHTRLQRFLPLLILSWTLLNLHSYCFVCHNCISTSSPFPCLKVF